MWVLPFLYYNHAYPITTFYQEWGAALLGLCAMPLLLGGRYWQQPEIPRVILLPLGLLLLLLLQYLLGKIPSLEQVLLFSMYFLWMALLVMLGQRLRSELGLPVLAAVLAGFLVLGAELSALAGFVQHYRWHSFLSAVVTVKNAAAVYGNIAQPNHYADYLALGLVSLGLLHVRYSLRIWQVSLLAAPLLFVLVLSGSRSAWLYLLFLVGISYLWQRRDKTILPFLRYALLLLASFILMHFVVQMPELAGVGGTLTPLERMSDETGSGAIRLYLWRESWLIFMQYPLSGAGFGQFAWQHFQLGAVLQDIHIVGLYNNAHNLVMQLAAETGLAGLSILFGSLILWARRAWCEHHTIEHWWGYALLAVLAIHSLLEYPLWYGYFIGIAAFLLGMLDSGGYRPVMRNMARLTVAVVLLCGVLSLVQLFQGYKKLEAALALRPVSGSAATYNVRLREHLLDASEFVLLRHYAELFMTGLIELSQDRLAQKLELNERAMRFVPTASVVYRQAWLLALSGRVAEAELQLQQALWSYPGEFRDAYVKLGQMASKDPAHFSALLEFATQKNEEYQRAVSGK